MKYELIKFAIILALINIGPVIVLFRDGWRKVIQHWLLFVLPMVGASVGFWTPKLIRWIVAG